MTKSSDKREAAFMRQMAKGGARRSLVPGQVLYERKPTATGVKDERLTWLNYANDTRYIMSARLSMDDGLRAVGNLYGGSVQLAEHGHGNNCAQEYVDNGRHGSGGGITPAMIEARQIADIAQKCMKVLPVIRHRVNSRKYKMGEHRSIRARQLVDAICVYGFELTEVAIRFDWWVQRSDTGTKFIQTRQKQKLKHALVDGLKEIDEAFQEHGIDARRIGVVSVG